MRRAVDRTTLFLTLIAIISITSTRCLLAQDLPPGCSEVCAASCLKPWTFADRWDDFSVAGSMNWSGNSVWDREKFTDTNANGYYDPGEPFIDGSSAFTVGGAGPLDGQFNAEYYDPLNTGYVASKDVGLELTFKIGVPAGVTVAHQFYAVDLPIPGSGATEASRYNWNIANCNPVTYTPGDVLVSESGNLTGPTAQGLRDLINQDPGAYWDDACQCVRSQFQVSPRIFIPLRLPRGGKANDMGKSEGDLAVAFACPGD
jgi:hypothetical protein